MPTFSVSRFCLSCLLPLLLALHAPVVEADELPKAPSFTLTDLKGQEHKLGDYAGKVVVVNFWASWCVPCREELPSMNHAASELAAQPVAWLAINVGEEREAVTGFIADYPIEFTVLLDSSGQVSQRWQLVGMPTTFILDPRGYVRHRIVGKREWDDDLHLRLVTELIDN